MMMRLMNLVITHQLKNFKNKKKKLVKYNKKSVLMKIMIWELKAHN